ncbi:hypothetical protein AVEN_195046-1 [Araneus ventricosus]|uniref:Uncharacterized protein n=1 Tax=Araneus ventricosus TaxID=182803 RepID=A0A4Y2RJG7_ARAVE|nr:hypothetical protein AVEN_195046-1 [Araneus ventricosus]
MKFYGSPCVAHDEILGSPESIYRLKAVHLFLDEFPSKLSAPVPACKAQKSEVVIQSGRRSRRVVHFQASPFSWLKGEYLWHLAASRVVVACRSDPPPL